MEFPRKNEFFYSLLDFTRPLKDLKSIQSGMSWDQETYMPTSAVEDRGEQMSTISAIYHDMITGNEAKEYYQEIQSGIKSRLDIETALYRNFVREFERENCVPKDLIEKITRKRSLCLQAWHQARIDNDFSIWANELSGLVQLKRYYASCFSSFDNPYDSLLEVFEPGITSQSLDIIFNDIKCQTSKLLTKISASDIYIDNSLFYKYFDPDKQFLMAKKITRKMAFDYARGRLDSSVHPFTMPITGNDVRITTRVNHDDLRSCIFGTIHETGHGLYEQGIDLKLNRTFLGEGASFGMHESQALLWENIIARTKSWCQWSLPCLKELFPDKLEQYYPEDIYTAINKVESSFIRTEADELTYNLHIIIRYEIEKEIINGNMKVDEIPSVFKGKMKEYLGIVPDNDVIGCMQDIHWADGMFGYFPSYTIGKLYAATIWKAMKKNIPDVCNLISTGDFFQIRMWLKDNIHQYGKIYTPSELINRLSGNGLNTNDFFDILEEKYGEIYGFG